MLGSDSDSDDSGPVFGGRSDDEGVPPLCTVFAGFCVKSYLVALIECPIGLLL